MSESHWDKLMNDKRKENAGAAIVAHDDRVGRDFAHVTIRVWGMEIVVWAPQPYSTHETLPDGTTVPKKECVRQSVSIMPHLDQSKRADLIRVTPSQSTPMAFDISAIHAVDPEDWPK